MIKQIRLNKKKGFTLIELIVVIAIIGILVLLAVPRFIGQTEKAREANIVHDIKVSESKVQEYLLAHDDFGPDWVQVDMAHMNGLKETGVLYSREGLVDPADTIMEGSYHTLPTDFVKTEVNSKLKGTFYTNQGGNVYYKDTKSRKQEKPEAETPIDMPIPDYYELATDSDFIWVDTTSRDRQGWLYKVADQLRAEEYGSVDAYYEYVNRTLWKEMEEGGSRPDEIVAARQAKQKSISDRAAVIVSEMEFGHFYYVGEADYVIIPDTIQGKAVESTFNMFGEGRFGEGNYTYSRVKGVAANNPAITNMSNMFFGSEAETLELLYLNTINVTDMRSMFYENKTATLDLSSFNTANVVDMGHMFRDSQATTLVLSSFDTANVTDMSNMFSSSQATTLDLSSFNTANVTDMSYMFWDSQATTLDLSSFDTANVTDMSRMFWDNKATSLDLSSFDTSHVKVMSSMFQSSQATTLDLSSFNTANVTKMYGMFYNSQATTLDLSSFNTANVTDMSFMFYKSNVTTLDLSSFDTSKTNGNGMDAMFRDSKATTGYARTQYDMDRLTSSTSKPSTLKFSFK